MLVIKISPSISDTKLMMTTTCEQKEEKNQHQKDKAKKHLENHELDELRVKTPHASDYNGTSCRFLTWGKTKVKRL